MACQTHDRLETEVLAAIHKQNLALDPGAHRARTMSGKALLQERADTKRALKGVEVRYNSHVASCADCEADKRTEWHMSKVKE
jgi:hypothetical protein